MVFLYSFPVRDKLAIQGRVRLPKISFVNGGIHGAMGRRPRQTNEQGDTIYEVLYNKFCGKIGSFLEEKDECNVQIVQYSSDRYCRVQEVFVGGICCRRCVGMSFAVCGRPAQRILVVMVRWHRMQSLATRRQRVGDVLNFLRVLTSFWKRRSLSQP